MVMEQQSLPFDAPPGRVVRIGLTGCLQVDGDLVTVSVAGEPLLPFAVGDIVTRRLVAAILVEARVAKPGPVSEALQVPPRTLKRTREQLAAEGVAGLMSVKRGPKGPTKLRGPLVRRIGSLGLSGKHAAEIAFRLRVSKTSVLRALRRMGVPAASEAESTQQTLPAEETLLPVLAAVEAPGATGPASPAVEPDAVPAAAEEFPATLQPCATSDGGDGGPVPEHVAELASQTAAPASAPDVEQPVVELPTTSAVRVPVGAVRTVSRASTPEEARLYAMLGWSPDGEAEVVLQSRHGAPFAGLLLTLPALRETGLLEAARKVYPRMDAGVYGLRATLMVLVELALLRHPRPEALKEADPAVLGDVLGLLRSPEVKTLRRKLAELAEFGLAHELLRELATAWLAERGDYLEVAYVDGHVRVYHGEETLPKAHVTQRNQSMKATTDYWVNDAMGSPLFVTTAQANEGMTKVLPALVDEITKLKGGMPGTVVFDRGGWCQELFEGLRTKGWHFLTYRKGKREEQELAGFREEQADLDGRVVTYTLSERQVTVGKLAVREIAELRDDGGQTLIVTSHQSPSAVRLAYRMFERWRQENYFKYMRANFALDALVEYAVVADDPARLVPNPAYKKLSYELTAARSEEQKLASAFGQAAASNEESRRPTMRGFKIANGAAGKALRAAQARVQDIRARRSEVRPRIAVGEVVGEAHVLRLAPERKLLTDIVRTAAYRTETVLLGLLRPHFARAEDEGRAFLRTAVQLRGDIEVQGDDVTVRLDSMSAPRYTAALRALCDELNAQAPTFPETTYRLRYEVAAADANSAKST